MAATDIAHVRAPITEIASRAANPGEYYKINQLLKDRDDLLAHCGELQRRAIYAEEALARFKRALSGYA